MSRTNASIRFLSRNEHSPVLNCNLSNLSENVKPFLDYPIHENVKEGGRKHTHVIQTLDSQFNEGFEDFNTPIMLHLEYIRLWLIRRVLFGTTRDATTVQYELYLVLLLTNLLMSTKRTLYPRPTGNDVREGVLELCRQFPSWLIPTLSRRSDRTDLASVSVVQQQTLGVVPSLETQVAISALEHALIDNDSKLEEAREACPEDSPILSQELAVQAHQRITSPEEVLPAGPPKTTSVIIELMKAGAMPRFLEWVRWRYVDLQSTILLQEGMAVIDEDIRIDMQYIRSQRNDWALGLHTLSLKEQLFFYCNSVQSSRQVRLENRLNGPGSDVLSKRKRAKAETFDYNPRLEQILNAGRNRNMQLFLNDEQQQSRIPLEGRQQEGLSRASAISPTNGIADSVTKTNTRPDGALDRDEAFHEKDKRVNPPLSNAPTHRSIKASSPQYRLGDAGMHEPTTKRMRITGSSDILDRPQRTVQVREPGMPDLEQKAPSPYYRAVLELSRINSETTNRTRKRKRQTEWSVDAENALIEYMAIFPRRYQQIQSYDQSPAGHKLLTERTQVQMKDKARNMAINMIKSRAGMMPGFEDIICPDTKIGKSLIAKGYCL